MLKYLFSIFFSILFFQPLSAQKGKKDTLKNRIEVFYAPAITKANLKRHENDNYDWFGYLYDIKKPTEPVYGYSFGVKYYKEISKRSFYTIGFNYAETGIKSIPFEVFNPDNPSSWDYLISYKYTLQSWQIPIQYYFKPFVKFQQRKKLIQNKWLNSIYINVNLIPDLHKQYIGKDYLTSKLDGSIKPGGISEGETSLTISPLMERLLYFPNALTDLSKGLIRVGLGAGIGFNLPISKNINVSSTFNFLYFTEVISKKDYIHKGDIYNAEASIGIGYIFDQKSKKQRKKERALKKKNKKLLKN